MVEEEVVDINHIDESYEELDHPITNNENDSSLRKEAGDNEFLKLLYCSKTAKAMINPVITADGMWYEREFIENYINTGNQNDPVTGIKFTTRNLIQCPRLTELANLYDKKHAVSD